MNLPLIQTYRLAPRGRGGLACDKAGVALGAADLVRVGADAAGRRRCEVRPRQGLGRIVSAAYGPQPEDVILRLHRGLRRAASAIEAGDLCLAGIETVLLVYRTRSLRRSPNSPKSPNWRKAGQLGKTSRASRPDSRTAVSGRQGKAQAAGQHSAPSLRRPSLLTSPLPVQSLLFRSTAASIGPGSTTRTSF
jgi:hypothetical protein